MESQATFTLSDEQVEQLFKFCVKHYVRDYDIQTELVDHLAESIEAKINADHSLTFEKALEQVYVGFGYKGFADVVIMKAKQIEKSAKKEKRRLFFSYFTLPKVIIVCVAVLAVYTIGQLFPVTSLIPGILVVFALTVTAEIVLAISVRKKFQKPVKPLMILSGSYFMQPVFSVQLLNIYLLFIKGTHSKFEFTLANYYLLSMAFILMLLLKLAGYHFWKETYSVAKARYPKAFA